MKIEQFHVKNQFLIYTEGAVTFQSYNSLIARKDRDGVTLDRNKWDYSKTTGKYRNLFLDEPKKETERKIAAGIYKLADLN